MTMVPAGGVDVERGVFMLIINEEDVGAVARGGS